MKMGHTPSCPPARRPNFVSTVVGIAIALASAGMAAAQPVTFEGATFVNKGLVGVARLPSHAVDQFGETLGGWGSGIALDLESWKKTWEGSYRGTLYAVPDRGWNTQGTTDFRGRVQKFDLSFQPFYGTSTSSQNQLSLYYRSSILFRDGKTTGLDPASVQPSTRRFPALPLGPNGHLGVDSETIALDDDTFWVSDEYGPYIYHFTHKGRLLDVIRPPEAFIPRRKDSSNTIVENFSANSPPVGVSYDTGNPITGRQNNQGFEGLSVSPDGQTLFVLLQSALRQDLDPTKSSTVRSTRRNTRLLAYDLRHHEPKLIGEFVVQLPLFQDPTTSTPTLLIAAQSELFALNDHQFLVLARDSAGFNASNPTSAYRSIDLVDISHATNIAGTKYDAADGSIAPLGVLDSGITPATYKKFLDINDNAQLAKFGLHNGLPNDKNDLYEKWEGIAIAPVGDARAPRDYFLFVSSDNDFITQQGNMAGQPYQDASGANVDSLVLVYRVTLPTYAPPHHPHWSDHGHDRGHRRD